MRSKQALKYIQSIESTWKGHELFALWLIKRLKPQTTLDIGFDRGLSTVAFSYQNRGQTFAIDWCAGNYCQKSFAMDSALQHIAEGIAQNYLKNVNLIVGPFQEIAKQWNRPIHLLHIDWAHRYEDVERHYLTWKKFLAPGAVVLIHDVESYPDETGRFFNELDLPKLTFPHAKGLGIATKDTALLDDVAEHWRELLKWEEDLQKSG